MTTLKEILDERKTHIGRNAPRDDLLDAIEVWAYGQDGEPGLVERLSAAIHPDWRYRATYPDGRIVPDSSEAPVDWTSALREELGDAPCA